MTTRTYPMPFDPENPQHREAKKMEIMAKLRTLLDCGIPTPEIAEILGAQEFLSTQKGRGKSGDVVIFDARSFIESQLDSAQPVQLPDRTVFMQDTFLPPGSGEIIAGSGKGIEEKEIIPRSRYFMELLAEMSEPYSLVDGTNDPNMMRSRSYLVFLVPGIKKAVFINNEEGNATYILHNMESDDEWRTYSSLTKDQLRENPDRISFHPYPGEAHIWKEQMREALLLDFSSSVSAEITEHETTDKHTRPEEKRKYSAPYTSESALAALEQAYIQWNAQGDKSVRGKFSTNWLKKKRFYRIA